MKKTKKDIKELITSVTRQAMTCTDPALRSELETMAAELSQQLGPEPAVVPESFAVAFRDYRKLLWLQAHKPASKHIKALAVAVQQAESELDGYLDYQAEQMRSHAFDGRPLTDLPTKPDPHVVYVADTLARAKELDEAGYISLCSPSAELLGAFSGSDIVLTHPSLHALAAHIDPDRYLVTCTDCWPGGTLDVVGTVPALTHLLSLAERHDVVPVQSSAHGKLAKQIYAAFDQEDTKRYQTLARQVVAA